MSLFPTASTLNASGSAASTALQGLKGLPPLQVSDPSNANPINTINFGAFQVGGAKNSSDAQLPTPNALFGGNSLLASFGGSPALFLAAAAILFAWLHHRG